METNPNTNEKINIKQGITAKLILISVAFECFLRRVNPKGETSEVNEDNSTLLELYREVILKMTELEIQLLINQLSGLSEYDKRVVLNLKRDNQRNIEQEQRSEKFYRE